MRTAESILVYLGIQQGQVFEAAQVQARIGLALAGIASSDPDAAVDAGMAALRPILSGTPWDGAADRADAASDLLSMLRQHFMTVRDFAGMRAGDAMAGIQAGASPIQSSQAPPWAQELLEMVALLLKRTEPQQ